jgi:sugar lactone lactonase YvrE
VTSPEVFPERPRVAVPCACTLGEGPLWDHRSGTLFWVDIKACTVFAWQPGGHAEPRRHRLAEPVAFVLLTPDPERMVVGIKSGLAWLDERDGSVTPILDPEPDRPDNRLNDGCIGPDGSLYFGTMDDGESEVTGGFYRWSGSGLASFGIEAVVTNGPAIDRERGLLYATNTSEGQIYRHRLGPEGRPSEPEPFIRFEPGWGHPDGMTVDAEGHLWVCHFGGSRITRFSPDGRPVLVVPVPTAQVTKVAFGGPDLTTLYITTAAAGRDRTIDPFAGDLLSIETGIRGQPVELCTVGSP